MCAKPIWAFSRERRVLAVRKLSAGYGVANVLSDIDLDVRANESVAIIGANGAGKSTLVRAICGLLPSRGSILMNEAELNGQPAYRRADFGIATVLEGRHLFGELSLETNLQLAVNQGQKRKDTQFEFTLEAVFDLFPFMRERRAARVELLSGGEQQMVAIARALLLNPDLLILDEPSTGLAPKVMGDIVGVITELRKRGMALLLIEQNVAMATACTDRAYVLSLGKVVDRIDPQRWSSASTASSLAKAYLGG